MIKPGPYNSRMIVVQYGVCSYSSRSCIHTHVHVRTSKRGQACDKQRKSDCCQTSSASVRVGSLLLYIYAMCNYDPSSVPMYSRNIVRRQKSAQIRACICVVDAKLHNLQYTTVPYSPQAHRASHTFPCSAVGPICLEASSAPMEY